MQRVTGIGGVFFKSKDPGNLSAWYEKHLGLKSQDNVIFFRWRDAISDAPGTTLLSFFPQDTKYFEPGQSALMMNYRVENLDELLEVLKAEGVQVEVQREDSEYGRFAWIIDPEGNKIELWQPPART
jgi:predicted enzyme related to lactoylglutathione lyase